MKNKSKVELSNDRFLSSIIFHKWSSVVVECRGIIFIITLECSPVPRCKLEILESWSSNIPVYAEIFICSSTYMLKIIIQILLWSNKMHFYPEMKAIVLVLPFRIIINCHLTEHTRIYMSARVWSCLQLSGQSASV